MNEASGSDEGTQRALDRYGSKAVLVLVVLAVLITLAAAIQTAQVRRDYDRRDERAVSAAARSVQRFIDRTATQQDAAIDILARQSGAVGSGVGATLDGALQRHLLPNIPDWILGVIAIGRDGRVVATVERTRGSFAGSTELLQQAAKLAQRAEASGDHELSGRATVGSTSVIASAVPVSARIPTLSALVFIYDIEASPIGTAFEIPSTAAEGGMVLADASGRRVLGRGDTTTRAVVVRREVNGTSWSVRRVESRVPGTVPPWVYAALLGLVVTVAVSSIIRDRERTRLRRQFLHAQQRVRALKSFAEAVLRAPDLDALSMTLAQVVVELQLAQGAGVRLARPQAQETIFGTASGYVARRAIVGGGRPVAELRVFSATLLDADAISMVAALSATAGAAMHTLDVLDRERSITDELTQLDELRVSLLSNVAHELRSPLTAVKGVLDLLDMDETLNDKQHEYVEVAARRTSDLVDLIADLLDASLLESGQLRLDAERHSALAQIEHALGAELAARPDEFIVDVPESLMVTCDGARLGQVLRNLVSNAQRYGATPIAIIGDRVGDRTRLVVVDSGAGIAPDDRDRVFARFAQTEDGLASGSGVGIGLSLVRSLIELHGGEIEVAGGEGSTPTGPLGGARFTILLPEVVAGPSGGTELPPGGARSSR